MLTRTITWYCKFHNQAIFRLVRSWPSHFWFLIRISDGNNLCTNLWQVDRSSSKQKKSQKSDSNHGNLSCCCWWYHRLHRSPVGPIRTSGPAIITPPPPEHPRSLLGRGAPSWFFLLGASGSRPMSWSVSVHWGPAFPRGCFPQQLELFLLFSYLSKLN